MYGLFFCVAIFLAWYFFVTEVEFQVNFRAQTSSGDIIQTLRIWNKSLDNSTIESVDSLSAVVQVLSWNGANYRYRWQFSAEKDSLVRVSAMISEPGRSFRNKLLVPFTQQQIEKDAKEVVEKFFSVLKEHLRITKVKVVGESNIRNAFCVCTKLETKQTEKAYGMMRDYDFLTSFITSYNLVPKGPPFVRVVEWSHQHDHLKFDFCFPIEPPKVKVMVDSIYYQEVHEVKALKAIYNGNYITSDRAWYELLQYAYERGYEPSGFPIEYFFSNPNLGLNESEWKAEIYLPIY